MTPPAERREDLLDFLRRSTSPYHAAHEVTERLRAAGAVVLDERDHWPATEGLYAAVRDGSVVAWRVPRSFRVEAGVRIVGAHTDSPNLRLMPSGTVRTPLGSLAAVEVYGGALWNSWLDRDLGISGRLATVGTDGPEVHLVSIDEPVAHIPQLAIHLDRNVNSGGLKLDPQRHLRPLWSITSGQAADLRDVLAARHDLDPGTVVAADLMFHDTNPPALIGMDQALLSSARIDNLVSCWAATDALCDPASTSEESLAVMALFDHEEVGSVSASGAAAPLLLGLLDRIVAALELPGAERHRLSAASTCLSVDGAHGTHPNYAERHEPGHPIRLGAGPVLKWNANERYATDAGGAAMVHDLAARCGVRLQEFVMRADLACGSTIGPLTAAGLGIRTVDLGVAQLAMHSARELCAHEDVAALAKLLSAYWAG
ncbi:MAG: M18 family aminopeptidase [Acidimicrobiia bacterium]|nr:M18 family aminopeptidase [Acidimicrobiia bacterium]